ncbi:GrpB family protein [Paenibacillus pasadenensis]|uniref:GrpB family protein n=1 Tax=Paenibacillus pasadenensis TaxID=217090 RepID=UPI00203B35B0|nr:GrpB family protein [Paenibacillus pasadenensis]MCM3745859.1 GrpB family protein [Paenibacillus pasadenensis]
MPPEVKLVDYDPQWAVQFELERAILQEILGNKAVAIEHIGSTSVQGLAAKPIIDIALAVKNLTEADAFIVPLQSFDYEYVPKEDFPARRFFRKGEWRKGTHHLHIYEEGSEEWENKLLFRNYLRNFPDLVIQYADLKKKLAILYAEDRSVYTAKKDPFIQEIIRRAQNERFE